MLFFFQDALDDYISKMMLYGNYHFRHIKQEIVFHIDIRIERGVMQLFSLDKL
jgi:hypothetical protein